MAMTKRTVTKYVRRRYARGYRRYRSLSNQYFKAKIEGVYTIAYPSSTGDPVFAEPNSAGVTFYTVLSNSQYFSSLINMFGFYKPYGVAMEVIPGPTNFKGTATIGAKTLVGFKSGVQTPMSYHELVANNNSILLGVDTRVRKYSSLMGSIGWIPASEGSNLVGCFSVASSITGTLNNQPTWTCRFSLYVMFKKVNV